MNPFEDMRIFCQVMDSGSFTAAADQLGLSKQFVSRRLMQLEERLGVRLLNRSTRRLDVTPLGQSYYESALRLLGEVEQVEQGIAGQTIGSRVVLIAPNAYPTGSTNPAVAAGETVVYVVDILFASPNA